MGLGVLISKTFLKKSPGAQFRVAEAYRKGDGVKQDIQQALEWYTQSAGHGNASAQYQLALMYDQGEGLEQNRKEAWRWYKAAADQGHQLAQFCLEEMEGGDFDQADEPANDTVQKTQRAAESGNVEAQYVLALMYRHGKNLEPDTEKMLHWLTEAAQQAHPKAQYMLATLYYQGKEIAADWVAAYVWFSKAAQAGLEQAEKACAALRTKLTDEQLQEAKQKMAG